MQSLLQSGADVDTEDDQNNPIIVLAVLNRDMPTLRSLLAKGAKAKNDALRVAAGHGSAESVLLLLEKGANPRGRPPGLPIAFKDRTALLEAVTHVINSHHIVIAALLEHGADPNVQDALGRTPLLLASSQGDAILADLLLQRGAQPDIQDSLGNTALTQAVEYGHTECADLLLDAGANPQFTAPEGTTVLHLVRSTQNATMGVLLKHAGARK